MIAPTLSVELPEIVRGADGRRCISMHCEDLALLLAAAGELVLQDPTTVDAERLVAVGRALMPVLSGEVQRQVRDHLRARRHEITCAATAAHGVSLGGERPALQLAR